MRYHKSLFSLLVAALLGIVFSAHYAEAWGPVFPMGGDLSGQSPNPTVAKIQGSPVATTTPGSNQVLTWNGSAWAPATPSAGGITALTGPVTASGSGSVASTITPGSAYQAMVTNSSGSSAGFGQVSLNQSAAVTGTLPLGNGGTGLSTSSGLTTGNVLQATSGTAIGYGAVNLAGGAGYVSGSLPTGNQASQSMGGDASGTTASCTVIGWQGGGAGSTGGTFAANGTISCASGDAACAWTQASTSSATQGATSKWAPQQSTQATNQGGGNAEVDLQTPSGLGAEADFVVKRGSNAYVDFGAYPGFASSDAAGWLAPGITHDANHISWYSGGNDMHTNGNTSSALSNGTTDEFICTHSNFACFVTNTSAYSFGVGTGSDFGGGNIVVGLAEASTNPTTVTSSSGVVWEGHSGDGLHYTGPSAGSFVDWMVAPTWGSTAVNSQASAVMVKYGAYLRTANASATTILTIPIASQAHAAVITATCAARCITGSSNCTADQMWGKTTMFGYKNSGGTVSAAGSVASASVGPVDDSSMTGAALSATVSGTNVLVQVAGFASSNVDWTCEAEVIND